ncbi:MAG: P-type Cu+ transporter [Patescibacteria group bacterium]|nr:P-type Cu+ transporter [Patescibacteria group bacterium]
MANNIFKVQGMHCASCASVITKKISKIPGVFNVSVNYGNEKARIDFDPKQATPALFNDVVKELGYTLTSENMSSEKMEDAHDHMGKENYLEELESKVAFIFPVSIVIFIAMMWDIAARTFAWIPNLPIPMELFNLISMIVATLAVFWVGQPYLAGVLRFVKYGTANMDTLIGIGTLTAYLYSTVITLLPQVRILIQAPEYTYFDVAIVVIGFVTLGKYLEVRSKKKTGDAIEKLLHLQAKNALVVRDGKEVEIAITEVVHDDVIIVKPGARIPVDGIIVEGSSFLDESMITGEPMPIEKHAGDAVVAGTLNTSGAFTFKATKVGKETLLSQIIAMVDEAQGSKAPIEALADKISSVFVPVVLVIAVLSLVVWLTIGASYLGFSQALSLGILSFVSILVIACPCALGLATPTAIIVGVGKGAQAGILIKDASTLEKLHKVNTVIVDKTGTITKGKPTLVDIKNDSGRSDDEFISLLASLEKSSEHPIAHAVVQYAERKNISMQEVAEFSIVEGKGLRGKIGGTEYFVGNVKFINELSVSFDESSIEKYTSQGKTPLIIATKEKVLGFATVSDELKEASKEAIANLHKLGIKVIMLTGDDERTAKYIASLVGIDEVVAHVLPQDKLAKVKELQERGHIVAMAGDGVNDAPALAQADVGIAMGTGTDVAIESAGITLLGGDISKIAKAISLSKMTMLGIKQNLFWAFFYNAIGIPLAAGVFYPVFGWLLNPIFAGLAMAGSSVSVVSNSLRIKAKKL